MIESETRLLRSPPQKLICTSSEAALSVLGNYFSLVSLAVCILRLTDKVHEALLDLDTPATKTLGYGDGCKPPQAASDLISDPFAFHCRVLDATTQQ